MAAFDGLPQRWCFVFFEPSLVQRVVLRENLVAYLDSHNTGGVGGPVRKSFLEVIEMSKHFVPDFGFVCIVCIDTYIRGRFSFYVKRHVPLPPALPPPIPSFVAWGLVPHEAPRLAYVELRRHMLRLGELVPWGLV